LRFLDADPGTESRGNGDFYIPRDECFDRNKMADFKADGARSIGHSLQAKAIARLPGLGEFNSIAEIKRLFVKKGQDAGGLNNVLADAPDVEQEGQFPLVFLQELVKPDGELNTPTLYPIPKILQREIRSRFHFSIAYLR